MSPSLPPPPPPPLRGQLGRTRTAAAAAAKRKVLKLLCQIERERGTNRDEGAPAFVAAARPLLSIENETNSKTQWKWEKSENTTNNMRMPVSIQAHILCKVIVLIQEL